MKTAVIYARYSSERQTEQSIDGQLRVCREYAERNDLLITDEYIDRAMTGTNDNRKAFQQMLKDSNKKSFDLVLVYKLDRFSRNKYETAMHKKTLRDNGVKLVSATENIPDTPEGIILESLLEGMAEYYSAELSQKVKRGLRETRAKGNYTGGYLLYGYKKDGKKVVIDRDKAEVVKYIFSEYTNGTIVDKIINNLTQKGILNKGKPFAKNTIYNMLRNEKYTGVLKSGDTVYTNIYPRIISDDVFNAIRRRNEENRYGTRSTEVIYMLRNRLVCGYCGSTMSAETGTARNGELKRYYKCYGKKRNNGCKKKQIRKELLEQLVVDTALEVINNDTISEIADFILKNHEEKKSENAELNILLKEKRNLQSQIDNFIKAIAAGIITPSTKEKIEELEKNLSETDAAIKLIQSKEKTKITKEDIVKYLNVSIRKEPHLMLQTLLKKVVLYDDKIEIHFNYIKNFNPDDGGQGFLFTTKFKTIRYVILNFPNIQTIEMFIKVYF